MTRTNYGLFILAAVLLALPLLLPTPIISISPYRMAINAIVVLGLNLLIGFAGQISLGHAGFFGVGAYASAVLTTHFAWPPIAALAPGRPALHCSRRRSPRRSFVCAAIIWRWRRWVWAS